MKTIDNDLLSNVCGGIKWSTPLALPGILPKGQFVETGVPKHSPLDVKERIVDANGKKLGKPFSIGLD